MILVRWASSEEPETMTDTVTLAHAALEGALRHATLDGLRDLHEALQTNQTAAWGNGKTHLTRGIWGRAARQRRAGPSTACPLATLFGNEARIRGGGVKLAAQICVKQMALEGYRAVDFYAAWDAGHLTTATLRQQVEQHLIARMSQSE